MTFMLVCQYHPDNTSHDLRSAPHKDAEATGPGECLTDVGDFLCGFENKE